MRTSLLVRRGPPLTTESKKLFTVRHPPLLLHSIIDTRRIRMTPRAHPGSSREYNSHCLCSEKKSKSDLRSAVSFKISYTAVGRPSLVFCSHILFPYRRLPAWIWGSLEMAECFHTCFLIPIFIQYAWLSYSSNHKDFCIEILYFHFHYRMSFTSMSLPYFFV